MIPVIFPEANGLLGATQEEYEPLPIYRHGGEEGRVSFCCALSDVEIAEIVRTRRIWVQQLTFGLHFQPIALSSLKPQDIGK